VIDVISLFAVSISGYPPSISTSISKVNIRWLTLDSSESVYRSIKTRTSGLTSDSYNPRSSRVGLNTCSN